MCHHDRIAFTEKDGFFTGALCSDCEKEWGIEDIREALRASDDDNNPYLLTGDELARTEDVARAGYLKG